MQRLREKFTGEVASKLMEEFHIDNRLAVPKITKVTINVGIGTYTKSHNKDNSNIIENIAKISGQKPVLTRAKKAISNFKTRKGEVIGIAVTIRGKRMYDLLNKLINIVFPRVKDFRGISQKSFDGKGNFSVGFKEHTVFPEISPDEVSRLHSLQLNICTNANTNERALVLLKAMGFPFKTN